MFEIFKELQSIYRQLTTSEQKIFDYFLSLINNIGDITDIIGYNKIVKETKLARSTVAQSITSLIEKGFLSDSSVEKNKGRKYTINIFGKLPNLFLKESKNEITEIFGSDNNMPKTKIENKEKIRELFEFLKVEYLEQLTKHNKENLTIQVNSERFYHTNWQMIRKALKNNPGVSMEKWKQEVERRVKDEYWLNNCLTFGSVERNFGKVFEIKKKEVIEDEEFDKIW